MLGRYYVSFSYSLGLEVLFVSGGLVCQWVFDLGQIIEVQRYLQRHITDLLCTNYYRNRDKIILFAYNDDIFLGFVFKLNVDCLRVTS